MAPGDLFQWISLSQKTGSLSVTSVGVEKTILFRDGRIIATASTDPREHLGQFLVGYGHINEEQLRKGMEVQRKSNVLLGKILVTLDLMKEDDLLGLMRLKAEESIFDIFVWSDGEFQFNDDDLPSSSMVMLNIEVTGIVMEGLRRLDEWRRIREIIIDAAVVPSMVKEIDVEALAEPQQTIMRSVNGHRTIEELILESRSSEFVVSKTLFDFAESGHVTLARPERPAESEKLDLGAIEVEGAAVAPDQDDVPTLLLRAQAELRKGEYERAHRTLKVAQNLDPHNARVKNSIKGAETLMLSEIRKVGVADNRIPNLAISFEELSSMNFTPTEGFILSRINGQWDIGSIVKVSPVRELDALIIFHRLVKDGVVSLL